MRRIQVGARRDDSGDPMQVVSGPTGTERVHFKAPAAKRLVHCVTLPHLLNAAS
jgi:hypothetical protein